MSIEKYKLKLEAAIYESCDKYYISGKIVEEVLKEYYAEQLNLPPVSNNEVAVCECKHGFKLKNFDKCAMCGKKWKGRKAN